MIVADKQSRVPVYEQIENQIITYIKLGVFPANSKLPSIRNISSETGVNINTVKRAFADLELSGMIYSVPGTGSFVSESACENRIVTDKILRNLTDVLDTAKSLGISKSEIMNIIDSIYGEA